MMVENTMVCEMGGRIKTIHTYIPTFPHELIAYYWNGIQYIWAAII